MVDAVDANRLPTASKINFALKSIKQPSLKWYSCGKKQMCDEHRNDAVWESLNKYLLPAYVRLNSIRVLFNDSQKY